jgi:cytochrome c-type biogenesis protein CcmH
MWDFWLAAGVMALLVAAILGTAMMRRRTTVEDAAAIDIALYRDQLAEIERDKARSVLSEEEAERVRVEISRRLLEADRRQSNGGAVTSSNGSFVAGYVLAALVLVASGLTYLQLGAPAYPDLPLQTRLIETADYRANRPTQTVVEAELGMVEPNPANDPAQLDLLQRLYAALEERPDDVRGFQMLAQFEARLGHFKGAHAAQKTVLTLKGQNATSEEWADYGDLLVLAAGGYVSPEAEQAMNRALALDPGNGVASYYLGLMYAQTGRPDLAFSIWRPVLEAAPEDAPWRAPIEAQIEQAAADGGIRYSLPEPATRGPSQDDVAAASDMSDEDRQAMIEGMVAGLMDRLANDGGSAQEWAQLIRARGVLGRVDEANEIAHEARSVFAEHAPSLDVIDQAAETLETK